MGVLEALLLIFVVLKLIGVIDWSWWWVFSPLYPAALIWFLFALTLVGAVSRR